MTGAGASKRHDENVEKTFKIRLSTLRLFGFGFGFVVQTAPSEPGTSAPRDRECGWTGSHPVPGSRTPVGPKGNWKVDDTTLPGDPRRPESVVPVLPVFWVGPLGRGGRRVYPPPLSGQVDEHRPECVRVEEELRFEPLPPHEPSCERCLIDGCAGRHHDILPRPPGPVSVTPWDYAVGRVLVGHATASTRSVHPLPFPVRLVHGPFWDSGPLDLYEGPQSCGRWQNPFYSIQFSFPFLFYV